MASPTNVRFLISKSHFSVVREDVALTEGTFTIAELPPDSNEFQGEAALLDVHMPEDAELTLTLHGPVGTGPNGESVRPEISKGTYKPNSPQAARGLKRLSGSSLAQDVVAPNVVHIFAYAISCEGDRPPWDEPPASKTEVRIFLAKGRFSVLQEEVVVTGGTVSIRDAQSDDPHALAEDSTLVDVHMPADAELTLTLRQANKMYTGPNGEFEYPVVSKVTYTPSSPDADKGLKKVSGGHLAQKVVAPHVIHVITYAPVCG